MDKDHPSPVESATDHDPDLDRVSHHMSVFPSLFRSPAKHWFITGVLGSGPSQVADVQPLPVERTTDHVPEPEVIWHHISVFPSPFKSPVRHWSLTRRNLVPQMGAGPFQVDVDQPLPVESPTDQPPAGPLSGEDFAHHTSVIPSPSRSPVKHCHAKRITLGSGAQEDVDHPLPVERPADE